MTYIVDAQGSAGTIQCQAEVRGLGSGKWYVALYLNGSLAQAIPFTNTAWATVTFDPVTVAAGDAIDVRLYHYAGEATGCAQVSGAVFHDFSQVNCGDGGTTTPEPPIDPCCDTGTPPVEPPTPCNSSTDTDCNITDPIDGVEDHVYYARIFCQVNDFSKWKDTDQVYFMGFTLAHQEAAGLGPDGSLLGSVGCYMTAGKLHGRYAAADGVAFSTGTQHCVETSVIVSSATGHPISQEVWLDGTSIGTGVSGAFAVDPGAPSGFASGWAEPFLSPEAIPIPENTDAIIELGEGEWSDADRVGCDTTGGDPGDGGDGTDSSTITVTITSPASGSTIDYSPLEIHVTAVDSAADATQPTSVTVLADGVELGEATGGPDFVFVWDWEAEGVPPGAYTLTAADGDAVSAPVVVNLADIEPPTVIFVSPGGGDTVSGLVDLAVDADDNVGVERVDFFLDGYSVGSAGGAPWRVSVDSSTFGNGSHTARAVALDARGNSAEATVSFNVGPFTLTPLSPSNFAAHSADVHVEVDFDTDQHQQPWDDALSGLQPWLWLQLDDASGSAAADSSGYARVASYFGSHVSAHRAGLVAGSTYSVRLADVSDSGVRYDMPTRPTAFTWAALVHPNSWSGDLILMTVGGAGGLTLRAVANGAVMLDGVTVTRASEMPLSDTSHVALVVETGLSTLGSPSSPASPGPGSFAAIYVNGLLKTVKTPLDSSDVQRLLLAVGQWQTGGGVGGDVTVDELAGWERALGAGEIQRLLASATTAAPPASVWTDITPYATAFSVSTPHGRDKELDDVQTAAGTVTLKNDDRRFEPAYPTSPYYPNVDVGRPLRVRALLDSAWHTFITAETEQWPPKWGMGRDKMAMTWRDGLGRLSDADPISGDFPIELTGARISRVLDAVGWTGPRNLDAGRLPVARRELEDADPLAYMQELARGENGLFFIALDGTATFHDRDHRATALRSTVPRYTFGDGGLASGEYPMSALAPDWDYQRVFNDIRVKRFGEFEVAASDPASIDKYGHRPLDVETELENDRACRQLAKTLLDLYAWPRFRFTSMQFKPTRHHALWEAALTLEIGDRINVIRRPPTNGDAGPAELLSCYVESVAHEVSLENARMDWLVTLTLSQPGRYGPTVATSYTTITSPAVQQVPAVAVTRPSAPPARATASRAAPSVTKASSPQAHPPPARATGIVRTPLVRVRVAAGARGATASRPAPVVSHPVSIGAPAASASAAPSAPVARNAVSAPAAGATADPAPTPRVSPGVAVASATAARVAPSIGGGALSVSAPAASATASRSAPTAKDSVATGASAATAGSSAPAATIAVPQFAQGVLTSPTSVDHAFAVSGLGFQPKAVIFFSGRNAATGNENTHADTMMGATDGTRQWAVTGSDENGNTTWRGSCGETDAACIRLLDRAGTVLDLASVVSLDADGFTLDFSTVEATGRKVHWLAIGGAPVSVRVDKAQITTGTGSKAVTGLGFQPTALLTALVGTTTTPPSADATNPRFSFGYASGASARAGYSWRAPSGVTADPKSHYVTNAVINSYYSGGSSIAEVADLTSFDSGGFTLNFTTNTGGAIFYYYVALAGVAAKVGAETQKTSTGTKATSGVGFQPRALLFLSRSFASGTGEIANAGRATIGAAVSTSSRGYICSDTQDGAVPSESGTRHIENKCFGYYFRTSSSVPSEADLSSMDSDGFTLNWTTADATARNFTYLALA